MSEIHPVIWSAMVEVQPEPGNDFFDGAPGAFSNVLGLACTEVEYRHLTAVAFGELGLSIRGFEHVRSLGPSWDASEVTGEVSEEFLELVRQLSPSSPLVYSCFYVYEQEFDA